MATNRTRQNINDASSSINAALSILNGVTPITTESTIGISFNKSLNPFQFIIDILEPIVGYDEIVNYLSELIVYGLPVLENAVKISMIASLKDLFSCSVNPIIGRDIINNGVVLDLTKIDLLNVLNRCPLGTENEEYRMNGSFFYSDVEKFTLPDQLVLCKDLNAVIWYVKTRSNERTVWYGRQNQNEQHEVLSLNSKPSSKDGIITMEYSEKPTVLKDSQNFDMRVQVPHGNSLHVFLGNTKGVPNDFEPSSDDLVTKTMRFQELMDELSDTLNQLDFEIKNAMTNEDKEEFQNDYDFVMLILKSIEEGTPISDVAPNMLVEATTGKRYFTVWNRTIKIDEYTYTHTKNDIIDVYKEIQSDTLELEYRYRTPEQNYYYHKTLFEFNTDYIMSLNLFDSKVLAAQIVNTLTGCFNMSLNISFEERLIHNEVEKMLTRILETSDVTVNDCFFSFTNDEYNQLLDETVNERIGRYTGDEYAYGSKIDYNVIYEELNKVSSSATQSEQIHAFNKAMVEISRTLKSDVYEKNDTFTVDVQFINNILKSLALSMIYSIISPKTYLLMAINLKILGREPNFDLPGFIENFKLLIISTIRGIVDEIMQQMKDWLMSLIGDLVVRMSGTLLAEQAEYYIRLLTSCMDCIRFNRGNIENWDMYDVDYADIYTNNQVSNSETVNTTC